jgi:hypothetical protein
MPSPGMTVDGLDTFKFTTARALDQLDDLDAAHDRAGAELLAAVDAPVDEGTLAASLYVTSGPGETLVGAEADHAPFVHWGVPSRNQDGQPFLVDALDERDTAVVGIFLDDVTHIVHTIRGA